MLKNRKNIQGLAFSLDGTLVNSLSDLYNAASIMCMSLNLPAFNASSMGPICDDIPYSIHRILTSKANCILDPIVFNNALDVFKTAYSQNLTNQTRAYAGVKESLAALAFQGVPMVVITNKPKAFAHEILETLGLSQYFKLVLAEESLTEKPPQALPLIQAANFLKIPPSQVAMVSNFGCYIKSAHNSGSLSIGATYGFWNVKSYKPNIIIDDITQLPSLFNVLNSKNKK